MKKYVSPEIEVLKLNVLDIIRTSSTTTDPTNPDETTTPDVGDNDMGWG